MIESSLAKSLTKRVYQLGKIMEIKIN